ncbi:hypothetical protein DERP_013632 [Dermatophagoides pteronyssinus]|uniref:Uncharacterized protein n=1 Tax=Dermatophagoides pteronyssinus TaxID=6956 RepID=A0ABQ8IPU7_DERPT|nr:hypothetical protein DERP_013632 [Dermatophagoides pteronyssinus]
MIKAEAYSCVNHLHRLFHYKQLLLFHQSPNNHSLYCLIPKLLLLFQTQTHTFCSIKVTRKKIQSKQLKNLNEMIS